MYYLFLAIKKIITCSDNLAMYQYCKCVLEGTPKTLGREIWTLFVLSYRASNDISRVDSNLILVQSNGGAVVEDVLRETEGGSSSSRLRCLSFILVAVSIIPLSHSSVLYGYDVCLPINLFTYSFI